MDYTLLLDTPFWSLGILPALIFLSRICDVTIGTVRIMFISRGYKNIAPLLSFFEVLIWLMAISQIMQNLTNVIYYFAYAGGFATGTYLGMLVEEKLAVGVLLVRIITVDDALELIECLKLSNYGVTTLPAQGSSGKVNIVFTVIRRNNLPHVLNIIQQCNPKAFYSIEDVKGVSRGVFPLKQPVVDGLFKFRRKGK